MAAKLVLVTGASSGIGEATAKLYGSTRRLQGRVWPPSSLAPKARHCGTKVTDPRARPMRYQKRLVTAFRRA